MIIIRLNTGVLDLEPGTSIRMKLKSPIWSSIGSLQGSFTFPFDLPATDNNLKCLNYPTQIDNPENFAQDLEAIFNFDGDDLFKGKLTVTKATDCKIKVKIIINNFSKLSDLNLKDLDFEGVRKIGDQIPESNMVDHANNTALNPQNYDYIFHPVYNNCFFTEDNDPGTFLSNYQNFWTVDAQTFVEDENQQSAMPFVKLKYVIERIFATCGIPFQNCWQTTDELCNLTLYNNYSIYVDDDTWAPFLNLKNHVPCISAAELLKDVAKMFGLSFGTSLFSSGVKLTPIKNYIGDGPNKDWTNYAKSSFTICEDQFFPSEFCFEECSTDSLDSERQNISNYSILHEGDPADFSADETAYILLQNQYSDFINVGGTNYITGTTYDKPAYKTGDDGQPCCSKLQPVYQSAVIYSDPLSAPLAMPAAWLMPTICNGGSIDYDNQKNDFCAMLMWYRGMQPLWLDGSLPDLNLTYPMATNGAYNIYANPVGECSLMWIGDQGLFKKNYERIYNSIRRNRTLNGEFLLPLKELRNFTFEDKIINRNRKYMIKELDITFTCIGLAPVKAVLVNTN